VAAKVWPYLKITEKNGKACGVASVFETDEISWLRKKV
jgi:hypothetical protein